VLNERQFRRLFPNASEATVAANCSVSCAKPGEHKWALVEEIQGAKSSVGRPLVRITRCAWRSLDRDNLWNSVKDLLDGLRYAHLIAGDSEKEIELAVCQVEPLPCQEEFTLIEISYE
jgi:hypothetical protein